MLKSYEIHGLIFTILISEQLNKKGHCFSFIFINIYVVFYFFPIASSILLIWNLQRPRFILTKNVKKVKTCKHPKATKYTKYYLDNKNVFSLSIAFFFSRLCFSFLLNYAVWPIHPSIIKGCFAFHFHTRDIFCIIA